MAVIRHATHGTCTVNDVACQRCLLDKTRAICRVRHNLRSRITGITGMTITVRE